MGDGSKLLLTKDEDHRVPLHVSVTNNNYEVAKLLVTKWKSPLDEVDDEDWTCLASVASAGYTSCVQLLIDNGVNVNAKVGPTLSTALHFAASKDHIYVVSMLVRAGADMNAQDKYGRTPLMKAAGSGAVETTRYLIDNGASLTLTEFATGDNVFHIAVNSENMEICMLLLENRSLATTMLLDMKNRAGKDPLSVSSKGFITALNAVIEEKLKK